jgi:hypothetical protein
MLKTKIMLKHIYFFAIILSTVYTIHAQEYDVRRFTISKNHTFYPVSVETEYQPMLYHLEAPVPGGNSYRSFLMQQKIRSKEHFDNQRFNTDKKLVKSDNNVAVPSLGLEFIPSRLVGQNWFPLAGGIPSDNTLAVSNDGILLLAMNSFIYAHDIAADTAIFENYRITLNAVAGGSPFSSYYDPKLYYDPIADRFILTFLLGNQPENSKVILCFSQTNNPNDGWHVYVLPGNPLDNNRWTDFPSIAMTEDHVYFTANLIIPDVSWQIGFDGSIIWKADKHAGFNGDDIDAVLFSDIRYEGRYIRNLNPVQGATGIADEMFLLSNRNFDIENDTIFMVRVAGDTLLEIQALKTDLPYGLPPNARQFNTNPSNPIYGLQTNDARVLAAIQFCDQIQFTANTINPETGFCAVYHGIIYNYKDQPSVSGNIIGDTVMDIGYPSIAWTGNEECDREVIIGFNITSFEHFPGVGAIYMNNQGHYSPILIVKEGLNYVQRLSGSYQRWGDFSGLQRKYNERNKVYAFGFLALEDKKNGGYCYELISPDTSTFRLHLQLTRKDICDNTVAVTGV